MGRNPATGETIKIAAKRQAKVTPLKAFKDSVLSGKAPRKTTAKKSTARKSTAKKAPARKTTAKKSSAKKTARRR
jgi:hypothetical protein